jgi:16S rRNA (cytidine1402-2'-O)-methyltransferase
VEHFGAERRVVVARELTKHYEEVMRGTAAGLLESWQDRAVRGEFTVVVKGRL